MPLSRLNPQQYKAATAKFGHNLIIASAGTGKTSTIVGRIAYLLSQNIKPQEILLLTFTNKAAAEMIDRVAQFFGREVASQIDAGTFHAVSYRWLKKEQKKVVLKQQRELKILFKSVYEKRTFLHIDAGVAQYGSAYLYDFYSFYQNSSKGLSFSEWIEQFYEDQSPFADIYADIVDEFETLKNEYGFVSFNDLLVLMINLAKTKELGYQEVLIDEYQDTNPLQGMLVSAMNPASLFCVGDYDQSIYAFNGADISIIASFTKNFDNATVYTLTKNYRSTTPILELANKVISFNERIYPKSLEVTRDKFDHLPTLLVYDELFDQYRGLAESIINSNTPRDEIAVIFRNNASADGIEASLRELGVACRRRGGTSFFDAKEIKAILDIYTVVVNESDMMAFMHIFEYAKGFGSASAKDIFMALQKLGDGSFTRGLFKPDKKIKNPFEAKRLNHQLGLFDSFSELGSAGRFAHLDFNSDFMSNAILRYAKFTNESATFTYRFYELIKELQELKNPYQIVSKIIKSKLYRDIVDSLSSARAVDKNNQLDPKLKDEAIERIDRKCSLLLELSKPYKDSERYLNAMVLGSSDLTQGEGVHLLSIHASKGLEYQEVYVCDLMDGRFPNRKLMARSGSIDEERRLFYVAVTRAKDRLFLSYARFDKLKSTMFIPSLFLYESELIPKDENYNSLVAKGSKD